MNVWQAARQIQYLLAKRVWPDSPGGPVFASVFITQEPTSIEALRFPVALVKILDSVTDSSEPGLKMQSIEVQIAVQHTGDQVGEFAMIGGQRASQGTSKGRGLLEVEEQCLQAIQFLNQTNGLRIYNTSSSAAEGMFLEGVGYIATRSYVFNSWLTSDRVYPEPNGGKKLTSSVNSGTVSLSWTFAERFDLRAAITTNEKFNSTRGTLLLVRKSGSSPPSSVSDGSNLTLSSNVATSYNDTPGAGTWTYALFARYDEFGDNSTSLRTSSSVYKTVTV